MRVLVTGGTGFVGCHSVNALLDAGHEVRVLARAPERLRPALDPLGAGAVECTVGDVTDPAAVRQALQGCDAVLHCASVYAFSQRRAAEMATVNRRGTEVANSGSIRSSMCRATSRCCLLQPTDSPPMPPSDSRPAPMHVPRRPPRRSPAAGKPRARRWSSPNRGRCGGRTILIWVRARGSP